MNNYIDVYKRQVTDLSTSLANRQLILRPRYLKFYKIREGQMFYTYMAPANANRSVHINNNNNNDDQANSINQHKQMLQFKILE